MTCQWLIYNDVVVNVEFIVNVHNWNFNRIRARCFTIKRILLKGLIVSPVRLSHNLNSGRNLLLPSSGVISTPFAPRTLHDLFENCRLNLTVCKMVNSLTLSSVHVLLSLRIQDVLVCSLLLLWLSPRMLIWFFLLVLLLLSHVLLLKSLLDVDVF